jgi:hypothetical protein
MTIVLLEDSVAMVGACTRDNPAFDGGSDGSSAASSTSSGQGEVSEDTSSPGTTGPDETSGGTTHAVDDTSTTATSETGEGTTDGTTGEPVCMVHPAAPIDITVHDASGAVVSPECGFSQVTGVGIITVSGSSISHQPCPACGCAQELPSLTLQFGASLSPPAGLVGCGVLAFWADPEPAKAGACDWRGFAVFDTGPPVPVYVASNARELPPDIFGAVTVGLSDEAACVDNPDGCVQLPGRYGLTFANDTPVFVGAPQVVDIAFAAALPFLVTNRMASIGDECREHVSWTGRQEL